MNFLHPRRIFNQDTGEEALTNGLFIAKIDSNGTCIWIAPVTLNVGTGSNMVKTPTDRFKIINRF